VSFDKYYPKRKDHRKPYYKSGRFDRSCRPGGNCPWCKRNRLFKLLREKENVNNAIKEYLDNDEA
jgi:hypothetical protein